MKRLVLALALGCIPVACAHGPADSAGGIGIVDVARLRDHWPKFKADDAELAAATRALQSATGRPADLRRRRVALRARFLRMQNDVTGDVRRASDAVARERGLRLVLTKESVGYGGVDVTRDVEKRLHIGETSAP